jgi:hypothetical protein
MPQPAATPAAKLYSARSKNRTMPQNQKPLQSLQATTSVDGLRAGTW